MNQLRKGIKKGIPVASLLLAACILLMPVTAGAIGPGARGPDVFAVQGMLKSLGSYAGDIDGVYGPLLKQGVAHFQRIHGLPVTGNVDGTTLQSILWAYGELKIGRTSPPAKPGVPVEPPEDRAGGAPLSEEEQLMLSLVNEERTKAGLTPLVADLPMSDVAELKSEDMAQNHYFSHQSPTYGSPFDMLDRFDIRYRTAGENIACNRNTEAAHAALMASEGHRENILNPRYTRIGIGIVGGGPCGKMFTQLFAGD